MTEISYKQSESRFIGKTFLCMALGLIITFVTAYFMSLNEGFINLIYSNGKSLFIIFTLQIITVSFIGRRVEKSSALTRFLLFCVYSILTGITFSTIFLLYELQSIVIIFMIAALMFFCSGMIGVTSKRDLSTVGRVSMMFLFGMIIATIVNVFIPSSGFDKFISYIGIVVFCGLTAYDVQKIKAIHENAYNINPEDINKLAVMAALEVYLDLINIFIYLIRLLGREK